MCHPRRKGVGKTEEYVSSYLSTYFSPGMKQIEGNRNKHSLISYKLQANSPVIKKPTPANAIIFHSIPDYEIMK